MLTKEALVEYGADYDRGIKLCLGKEDFYFKMITKGMQNEKFADLGKRIAEKNIQAAFEDAHALKGISGNLALTPLFNAIEAIVEPLRRNEEADYDALYKAVMVEYNKILAIIG